MTADLLVTGTGALAEAVLFDLAAMPALGQPMDIVIAGRNAARLEWLTQAANARAFALETHHRFAYMAVDWDAADDLARLLDDTRPRVVFHTASLQSMWEIAAGRDAWAAEIRASGYGATLPLQLALSLRVARAIGAQSPASRLVNACYPDASNEILSRLGYDVVCGIGNVATLAAAYGAALRIDAPARLRMLAHHRQVSAAIAGESRRHPPRVWIDATPALGSDALPNVRLPASAALNLVTAAAGAQVLAALLGRIERHVGHAPGPNGLPGGYPVVIGGGRLVLDLPAGMTVDEAVALNREWGACEGVSLDAQGIVRIDAIASGSRLPDTYRIDEIEAVAHRMMRVKADLQRQAA
jgi:hypothetical protein